MTRNTRMPRNLFVIALLGASLLAVGCKRDAEPADAGVEGATAMSEEEIAAAEGSGKTDAIAVVESSAADAITYDSKGFDSKSFVGTFTGTGATVELKADGNFVLSETGHGSPDGAQKIDGTWTVEDDGKQLRLDPSSKEAEDRLFAIVSNDQIRRLGKDGGTAGMDTLQRDASAQ